MGKTKPEPVEVFDREGRLVLAKRRSRLSTLISTLNPLNLILRACAAMFAFGIFLIALGEALQERARSQTPPEE